MSNSVAMVPGGGTRKLCRPSLYALGGVRKYVNLSERAALLGQIAGLPADKRLFVLCLMWTGARVSEVLSLSALSFQLGTGVVSVPTLKRRAHVVREIPIPEDLESALDREFGLSARHAERPAQPLWRFHRVTAWRLIKRAMDEAGIAGIRATPRGLRHAFGVTTLAAGLPITVVQRLLGHSSVHTTAIYTEASGPEERAYAAKFWLYVEQSAPRK